MSFLCTVKKDLKKMSRPKSIKFIEVEKNKLRLTKEAIELLEEQKEPFGVLVCLGPYRMGKSYLLNRIVEEKTAFGVGHTDLGETKGLYIFDRLVQIGDDKGLDYGPKFLVLDTEGLQSDDNSEEVDTKLFLISFLLSSLLIYNTKSALNRETFNQLDIITNLSEKVKVRRRTEDDDRPDLLWVVRDYSLHSTKRPNERVQDFLESEKFEFDSDSSKQANEKRAERVAQRNKVREAMINSFHSFGCHYFPVPISDGTAGLSFEEAMQSMNRLDIDDLRPEFNLEMDRLKKSIGEKMRLKSVGGKVFSDGRFYMDFIQQCIDKINTDSSILDSDFELFWINKKIEKMEEEHKKKLKEKEERIDNLSDLIAQLKESNQDLEKKVEDLKTEINERKNKQEALESAQKSKSTLKTSDDEDETIYKVSPRNLTTNSRTPDLLNTSALSYTSASITEYNYPSPACSQTSISGEGSKYHPANIRNKSTTTPTSTYYPPSPPSSVCGSSSTLKMLYNKDGTPDKRCSAYRASLVGSDGVPRNSNGKPDMRYTENKIRFGGHNY